METVVTVPNGIIIPISSLAQTLGWTGGNLTTISVVYDGITFVQTLTWSGSTLTNISAWTQT